MGSNLCVGIDPDPFYYDLRIETLFDWCSRIIECIHDKTPACKLQLSFFEQFGWEGVHVAERVIGFAKEMGLLTILDYKRGDVPHVLKPVIHRTLQNSEGKQCASPDAITLNPFVSLSALFTLLRDFELPAQCAFISTNAYGEFNNNIPERLARASRAFSDELVASLSQYRANQASPKSIELGLVSSCLFPNELLSVAENFGGPILIPGLGAQKGALPPGCLKLIRKRCLISASRSIIPRGYQNHEDWLSAVIANIAIHTAKLI